MFRLKGVRGELAAGFACCSHQGSYRTKGRTAGRSTRNDPDTMHPRAGRRLRLLLAHASEDGFCSSDSNFPNLVLKFYPGECDNEYVGAAGQYPSQFAVPRPDPCPAGRPARLRPAFFHSAARLRL